MSELNMLLLDIANPQPVTDDSVPSTSAAAALAAVSSNVTEAATTSNRNVGKIMEDSAETKRAKQLIDRMIINSNVEFKSFFFIMANYFCKLKNEEESYVPAEISIIKFTLLNGIVDIYHTFVSPKIKQTDLTQEAEEHAERVHHLPLPPDAKGEKDLSKIFDDIINFIGVGNTEFLHYLFTDQDAVPMIRSVIDYIEAHAGATNVVWHVYPIQYLLFKLKQKGIARNGYKKHATMTMVNNYFAYDFFMHEKNISCSYHETLGKTVHCSLSYCIRWGHTFSSYLCTEFGINCDNSKHVPTEAIETCPCVDRYEEGHVCIKDVTKQTETEQHSIFTILKEKQNEQNNVFLNLPKATVDMLSGSINRLLNVSPVSENDVENDVENDMENDMEEPKVAMEKTTAERALEDAQECAYEEPLLQRAYEEQFLQRASGSVRGRANKMNEN